MRPSAPPPDQSLGALGWLRANLFSSVGNTLLTFVGVALFLIVVPPVVEWAVLEATVAGTTKQACDGGGACWVFIKVHLPQFIYGFYPEAERWRVNLAFAILVGLVALLFIRPMPKKGWIAAFTAVVFPFIAYLLFFGGIFGLPVVPTSEWGGLFLTLIIAGVAIAASLPLGILLALGRRSEMPVVQAVCTVFIEFWRGVPLITVLFMASVMLPLFLPGGVTFDKLLRAMVGWALFAGAYTAEVVRGGLAGVPPGQYEAAKALGLGYWRRMRLIILPQALRIAIPGIVNSFLAIFKDTTLVLIIGLFDLLGIIQAIATDPEWLGYAVEGYVFAAAVFWAFCYAMSKYSMRVERQLNRHKQGV
ncbi:amino acid ABC transporter permease [Ectothiorhodospiraceae bacterium WFHF3C12]|nr:amino acid ABC transporter permease [Ectothiorhodospiraceae bacterium WFHF3C12]